MDIAEQERLNLKLVKEVEKYPCLYKMDTVEYCRRSITDKAWAEVGRVVGWPGQKCKEKFKNIRSVVCRYKRLTNAGAKKRPYYLMEHMHYAFPYIKAFNDISSIRKTETQSQPEKYTNTLHFEEIDNDNDFQGEVKIEKCDSPYTSPKLQYYEDTNLETYVVSPSPSPKPEPVVKQDQTRKLGHEDTSNGFNQSEQRIDSVETPAVSMDTSNELQNDPKKMFLLSLLPDVYAMDEKQTRKFKRGVLQLVDEILSDS